MKAEILIETVKALMGGDRGLLAMDESTTTCNRRFAAVGVPQTEEARRAYRELIVTTPRLGECISGAILYDETVRQSTKQGVSFLSILGKAGIVPGIKVDKGTKDLPGHAGEKITEGLDNLDERLREYAGMGLRFAKWRAVFSLRGGAPSRACLEANAHALARYAALCQEYGLAPIVEPEVLMDGGHSLEACEQATEAAMHEVFIQLRTQGVLLEGMILKPNMVVAGIDFPRQPSVDEVAVATMTCLARNAPAAVGGVAFLSGGQTGERASAHLNAMNIRAKSPDSRAPWPLTFSYARAIQQPALEIWRGDAANVERAQRALYHRAACNRAARRGEYTERMESGETS
jgi:fructose-bisphosphate aldolase, class I